LYVGKDLLPTYWSKYMLYLGVASTAPAMATENHIIVESLILTLIRVSAFPDDAVLRRSLGDRVKAWPGYVTVAKFPTC
jgi:hypothetical protein